MIVGTSSSIVLNWRSFTLQLSVIHVDHKPQPEAAHASADKMLHPISNLKSSEDGKSSHGKHQETEKSGGSLFMCQLSCPFIHSLCRWVSFHVPLHPFPGPYACFCTILSTLVFIPPGICSRQRRYPTSTEAYRKTRHICSYPLGIKFWIKVEKLFCRIRVELDQRHSSADRGPESWLPAGSLWTVEDQQSVLTKWISRVCEPPRTPEVSWDFAMWTLKQKVLVPLNSCFRVALLQFISRLMRINSNIH